MPVQVADPGPTLKTGWRGKEKTDDASESPQIGTFAAFNIYLLTPELLVLKTKKCRKPLKEIKNYRSEVDDASVISIANSNSPPSLTVSADDTFDKLIEKKSRPDDPFDKLFEKVNDKVIDVDRLFTYRFDRVCDKNTPCPSVVHSVFSSPSETEASTDNSNHVGLFSSFTKVDTNTPKLKKKSHKSVRTKKNLTREECEARPRDCILSETLDVQVVFENDISPNQVATAQPSKVSSLATIHSPIPLRTRTLTATSTPVLASRSSDISLSGLLL